MKHSAHHAKRAAGISLLVGLMAVASVATAHTPYLVPNAFEPINGGLITLDASFAERFFVPEIVFNNSQFEVRLPDGSVAKPDTVIPIQSRIIVEHDMVEEGTYRFSTGRRLGRVFRTYELKGERFGLEDASEPLPEGAILVDHYQSNTIAETYVTRGGPSDKALEPRQDGLEFAALTHPNDLFVGESLDLQALYYGKPLPGLTVEVFQASRQFGDDHPVVTITSGGDGEMSFTPEEQGIYLLRSRHRDYAPEGSAAPEFSHTYTLVVEAF
ncbi:DUF4198 domain-containing protein [Gammaproteobacteria bacterium]|nr:DUF4198 domain-containing protein [Gammaproteobacteria bacterium]